MMLKADPRQSFQYGEQHNSTLSNPRA